MHNLSTRLLAPPVNDYFLLEDFDDTSVPSTDYEVFGLDLIKRFQYRYKASPLIEVQQFRNALSDVAALIRQASTTKSFQLSKEEDFISRYGLSDVVDQAYLCVWDVIGSDVLTSLEYCKDPEGSELEWLDFNLRYDSVDETDIESLLEQVDQLSAKLEEKVGISAASNLNFYLDIK